MRGELDGGGGDGLKGDDYTGDQDAHAQAIWQGGHVGGSERVAGMVVPVYSRQ